LEKILNPETNLRTDKETDKEMLKETGNIKITDVLMPEGEEFKYVVRYIRSGIFSTDFYQGKKRVFSVNFNILSPKYSKEFVRDSLITTYFSAKSAKRALEIRKEELKRGEII